MKYLFLFIYFLNAFGLIGQNFHYLNIPVYNSGEKMHNPWAGGLNAPQWSSIDLDMDGKNDLYAFDRMGNVHVSFLNNAETPGEIDYVYSRNYLKNFPNVQNFVLMRDFNHDGVMDLFANSLDEFQKGIKVFKGSFENGLLNFDRILFPEYNHDILTYESADTIVDQITIWLQVDYPVVDDVDGDGDIDILAMNQAGNKVIYYKNISLEKGYTTDTLIYELADDCWGRFGLTIDTSALVMSMDMDLCVFFDEPNIAEDRGVHGGTTLCTFDNDHDGDKEILYGDLINEHIIFGKNNGTSETAWMTEQDTLFPIYDTPINIPFFSTTFYLDINNDGARDLIASPNQIWKTPDIVTAWFYENIGSDELPEFNLRQKDFLADNMLDFGTGANPVFADVNGDGLMDLVSGNRELWTPGGPVASLFLLLNIGTATAPEFELADEDWLGLRQYSPELNTLAPAFGDLDNDGDEDVLLGDRWGNLHFAENVAGPGAAMQFGGFQFYWKNINVGQISTPFIHDINKDGLPDLLIGELKGTLNYFPNIGTPGNPGFHPVPEESPNNSFFGEINTQPLGSTVGYTQPHILEFGDTMYLVSGSFRGWIKRYLINPDSLDAGSFELLDGEWGGLREGSVSRIAFANLNNDEFLDAVIGNDRGGLTMFQSPITVDGLVNDEELFSKNDFYKIYPNPTDGQLNIIISEKANMAVYDVFGRAIYFSKNNFGNKKIDLSLFDNGIYFIKIEKGDRVYSERIVLMK